MKKKQQHSINTSIGVINGQANMSDEKVKLMKLHQREAKLNKKLMTLGPGIPKKYVSIKLMAEYEESGWYLCDRKGNKKEDKPKQTLRESKLGEKNPMYVKTPWNKGKKGVQVSKRKGKKEEDKIGYIKVLKNHGHKWILPEELDEYILNGWHQKAA